MNLTISAATFNNSDKENAASINIKNNKEDKNGVSKIFQGVSLSGAQVDRNKLDNNTYESLLKEADNVKEQIMASATNAKDNLKALFNRLSGADAVKIDEDGFNLNDATMEDCVNIVDRIKIELAMHSDNYQAMGSGVSLDKIKQVVGSTGYANEIAGKLAGQMEASDLPVTTDNINDIKSAVVKLEDINSTGISESAKNTLIANGMEPTIDNVCMAVHSGMYGASSGSGSGISTANPAAVSEQDYEQLKPQIEKIIKDAGLENNQENLDNAKSLLNYGVPVTAENLIYKSQLDSITTVDVLGKSDAVDNSSSNVDNTDILQKIVNNMSAGGSAGSTLLSDGMDAVHQVAEALATINNADYRHVESVISNGEVFTINNLKNAITSIDQAIYSFDYEKSVVSDFEQNSISVADISNETVNAYAQLQELRILMTAEAGMFLAKQGVNINAVPVSQLIAELTEYDMANGAALYNDNAEYKVSSMAEYSSEQEQNSSYNNSSSTFNIRAAVAVSDAVLTENTVNGNSAVSEISRETVMQVRKALYDINEAPDVTIGAMLKTKKLNEALTIGDFSRMGRNLRQRYEQAGHTYIAVGTEVRKDLGDSIRKALQSSTKELLEEIGLENTKDNQDAVRILASNSMEITTENVENIKSINATLNSVIDNMTPETVLQMVRDNINPMSADIRDVNNYLREQNENNGVDVTEKYSQFLYKLDKTNGITDEEREKFIGIYKMMNIFTKDAGAAIGALVKQDADITMQNLYTAYQSRKSYGMDAAVDDETGVAQSKVNYYMNLFDSTANRITPYTLKSVNDEQLIDARTVENFCEAVNDKYDSGNEALYSTEYIDKLNEAMKAESAVIDELNRISEPVTLNNIIAMEGISSSGFGGIMSVMKKDSRYAKTFADSIESREALQDKYSELESESEEMLNNAVKAEGNQTYNEINELRMKNREIGMIKKMSLRNDYRIPAAIGDNIVTINLTMVQDEKDSGRVSVEFNDDVLGHVSVEAKMTESSVSIFVAQNNNDSSIEAGMEQVVNRIRDNMGIQDVSFNLVKSDAKRITYDNNGEQVSNGKLYQLAKNIIVGLSSNEK